MAVRLTLNGEIVEGLLRCTIVSSNYFSSDTFSCDIAIGRAPLRSLERLLDESSNWFEFSSAGGGTADEEQIILGKGDRWIADSVLRTVSVEGRDLSSALLDSTPQEAFVNQTASEIVRSIAERYGLIADVASTPRSIGRYFGDAYSRLTLGGASRYRSNWDLIAQLARENDFDAYVSGRKLYFGPSQAKPGDAIPLRINDVMSMTFEQDRLSSAKPGVSVRTWDSSRSENYVSSSAMGAVARVGIALTTAPDLAFSQPNLTPMQADAQVAMYNRELSRPSVTVRIQMPWDIQVRPRRLVSITKTRTPFDGLYLVDRVERMFSAVGGSTQHVTAVAWSP